MPNEVPEKQEEITRGPGKIPVILKVNSLTYDILIEPRRTLLDALHIELHLTGTKKGCDMGECGACTVLFDGKAVYACLLLAVSCEGHEITTIEGLSSGPEISPLQKAFIKHDAFQCGFCTPGQIMTLQGLFNQNQAPDEMEIRLAISGNICRCGTYQRIIAAAKELAGGAINEALERENDQADKD